MQPLRTLIVDDHPIVLEGLKAIMSRLEEVEIVGEATCIQEALYNTKNLRPDIVVMEALMPYLNDPEGSMHVNGIETTFHIKQIDPSIKVIVFTTHNPTIFLKPLVRVGISAFVHKQDPISNLCEAVRVVNQGGSYFSSASHSLPASPVEPLPQRGTHLGSESSDGLFGTVDNWMLNRYVRPICERSGKDRRRRERRKGERRHQDMNDVIEITESAWRRSGEDRRKEERRHGERRAS